MTRCEDCGGELRPRKGLPGFSACVDCGKLIAAAMKPVKEEAPPDAAQLPKGIRAPDYMEARIGWRAWGVQVREENGPPVLQSVTYNSNVWTPGEVMVATCGIGGRNHIEEGVPGQACSCGLYSAKTLEHLQSMSYHRYDAEAGGFYHVVGSVSLWGKIVEGSQGWRAEKAYPRELFLPFEAWHLATPLTEAYRVPVRLKNILSTKQQEV